MYLVWVWVIPVHQVLTREFVKENVGDSATISFVKAKQTLLVKALNALPVGLIDGCPINFVEADLTGSLVEVASQNYVALLVLLELGYDGTRPQLILSQLLLAFCDFDKRSVLFLRQCQHFLRRGCQQPLFQLRRLDVSVDGQVGNHTELHRQSDCVQRACH